MTDDTDNIREVPCRGPSCQHPPGHLHYQAPDGHGQIWSADGEILDLFDLTLPATLVPVFTPLPSTRWRGRTR